LPNWLVLTTVRRSKFEVFMKRGPEFQEECRSLARDARRLLCRTSDADFRDVLRALADELEAVALKYGLDAQSGSDAPDGDEQA
jgi:hypothetical protein